MAKVHEFGGYGSTGYRAPWSDKESSKLLLRTHTTASSASMLWKLAARCRGEKTEEDEDELATHSGGNHRTDGAKTNGDGFRPAKLFSVDRVFRNETMDATHLAEFHQVEGVVADRGLTLADLIGMSIEFLSSMYCAMSSSNFTIGFMRVFFRKMGIENIRFKPAYNPYTEVILLLLDI